MKYLLSLFGLTCIMIICSGNQRITGCFHGYTIYDESDTFRLEPLRLVYDLPRSIRKHKPKKTPPVFTFQFFKIFDDTVTVVVNSKEVARVYVHTKNNPATSSGYSGHEITMTLNPTDEVEIRLLKQKRYVKFSMNGRYRLFTVQRYQEMWYVQPRTGALK